MSVHLCELCLRVYSACMNEHENMPEIEYGSDGENNDAVTFCSWFMAKPKEAE